MVRVPQLPLLHFKFQWQRRGMHLPADVSSHTSQRVAQCGGDVTLKAEGRTRVRGLLTPRTTTAIVYFEACCHLFSSKVTKLHPIQSLHRASAWDQGHGSSPSSLQRWKTVTWTGGAVESSEFISHEELSVVTGENDQQQQQRQQLQLSADFTLKP